MEEGTKRGPGPCAGQTLASIMKLHGGCLSCAPWSVRLSVVPATGSLLFYPQTFAPVVPWPLCPGLSFLFAVALGAVPGASFQVDTTVAPILDASIDVTLLHLQCWCFFLELSSATDIWQIDGYVLIELALSV